MIEICENATYAAVILAAYEEEKTAEKVDEKSWRRIRLIVDLIDSDVYGYFTAQYNDFSKQDKYHGVIDWYLPTADFDADRYGEIKNKMDVDVVLATIPPQNSWLYQFYVNRLKIRPITDDDRHYYNSYNQLVGNYNSLLYYNCIDTLPADLSGLLVPVTVYRNRSDGIGTLMLSPYLPLITPPIPAPAYNLADFVGAEEAEKSLTGYTPYGMAAMAAVEKVKGKDISVASKSALTAFLTAKKGKNAQSTTTPPLSAPSTTQSTNITPLSAPVTIPPVTVPPLSTPTTTIPPTSFPAPSLSPRECVDYALSIFGIADDNNIIGGGKLC